MALRRRLGVGRLQFRVVRLEQGKQHKYGMTQEAAGNACGAVKRKHEACQVIQQ
jgi:hypothetical protein